MNQIYMTIIFFRRGSYSNKEEEKEK